VNPASSGEQYAYTVDKFWVVAQVLAGGDLLVNTRRGKSHRVSAGDPDLHRARWWERLLYRQRFTSIANGDSESPAIVAKAHRQAG